MMAEFHEMSSEDTTQRKLVVINVIDHICVFLNGVLTTGNYVQSKK